MLQDLVTTIYDSLDDIILIINSDFEIENINRKGKELYGGTIGGLNKEKCYNVICNKKTPHKGCPLHCLQNSTESDNDYIIEKNDRFFEIKTRKIELDGQTKFLDVLHDITDLVKAREQQYEISDAYHALNEEYLSSIEELEEKNQIITKEKERYELLFQNMNSAFAFHEIVVDKNGIPSDYRFVDCNPMFEKLTGLKKKDIIGKTVLEVMPNTEKFWIETYGNVALTQIPIEITNFSHVLDKYYSVKSYSPKKGFFAVTFNDVTETIKAKEALEEKNQEYEIVNKQLGQNLEQIQQINSRLEESIKQVEAKEKTLQAIFNNAPSTMILLDENTEILQMNQEGIKLSRKHEEDILGKQFGNVLKCVQSFKNPKGCGYNQDCERCKIRNTIANTLETGKDNIKIETEFNFLNDKGMSEKKYLILSTTLIDEFDSKKILITMQDITELKQKENAILESEAKYKSLYSYAGVGIGFYSKDGNIIEYNDVALKHIGLTKEQVFGKHISDIYPGKKGEEYLSRIKYTLEKRTNKEYEDKITFHNSEIWFHSTYSVVYNSQNEISGVQIMSQDISTLKNYQLDLIKAKERAEKADKLKTLFLANMSHEIRTPLNGIIGFSDIMASKTELTEGQRKTYASVIKKSSDSLLTIVNDILDISALENRTLELKICKVELSTLLYDLYNIFNQNLIETGKKIELNITNDVGRIYINSDEKRLIQIFHNLLSNACKFTQEGNIDFGIKSIGNNKIVMFVKDTGIGIAPENQKSIFSRFVQAEASPNRRFGGNGLGLSIVHELLNLMKGEIWIESGIDKGSCFYFSIPIDAEINENKISVDEEKINSEAQKTLDILVVEDDAINTLFIKELLLEINSKVCCVVDGRSAVEKVRGNSFDVVLMDVRLPDISGLDATREIRKFNSTIPIIAQTAYAMQSDKDEALQAGCTDYISKPIDRDLLFQKLAGL